MKLAVIIGVLLLALLVSACSDFTSPGGRSKLATPNPINPTPGPNPTQPTYLTPTPKLPDVATATPGPATPNPTAAPQPTPGLATPAAPSTPKFVSLNYDETNNDGLTPGQTKLLALYVREALVKGDQSALEAAVRSIQQEAVASKATTAQGSVLKLDQHQAWLVWTSDASGVTTPSDVSSTASAVEGKGRLWIQVPFAEGVPLRSRDTWSGSQFWVVAVH